MQKRIDGLLIVYFSRAKIAIKRQGMTPLVHCTGKTLSDLFGLVTSAHPHFKQAGSLNVILVAKSKMALTLSLHFSNSKRENRLRHQYQCGDEPK
jgi:hypothetical protein